MKLIHHQHAEFIFKEEWDLIKETVMYLCDQGLRVDGIGCQAHFNAGWENRLLRIKQSNTLKTKGRLNPEMGQGAIRSYFSCISFMDEQVGKVLNKLKELNLAKNTIVECVDIYPSLAELCGLPQPTNVEKFIASRYRSCF